MGLSQELLRNAAARGLAGRRACSPLHPPSFPPTAQWADTQLALRELLIPHEWKPDNTNNYPTIISPNGKVAITVATGDLRTGRSDLAGQPTTKHPKGARTEAAVETNRQLAFSGPGFGEKEDDDHPARRETWIYLIHTGGEFVHSELSQPDGQSATGHVNSWSERLILEPLEIPALGDDSDEPPPDDDIDVPVERI